MGRRVNSSLSAAGSKVTELAKISFVQIPAESISQEALEGLVEEFVTRNGTERNGGAAEDGDDGDDDGGGQGGEGDVLSVNHFE